MGRGTLHAHSNPTELQPSPHPQVLPSSCQRTAQGADHKGPQARDSPGSTLTLFPKLADLKHLSGAALVGATSSPDCLWAWGVGAWSGGAWRGCTPSGIKVITPFDGGTGTTTGNPQVCTAMPTTDLQNHDRWSPLKLVT